MLGKKIAPLGLLGLVLALQVYGSPNVKEIDEGMASKVFSKGFWLILLSDSSCSSCRSIISVMEPVASQLQKHIQFGVLKGRGMYTAQPVGSLLLIVGQGPSRYVKYEGEEKESALAHFLWHFLGEEASRTNRFEEALQFYRKALKSEPDHAELHRKVGQLLHQHSRDLEAAVQHYEKALAKEEDLESSWNVQYMAGNAYLTLGYPERARQCYRIASERNPSLHSAYRESAIAASIRGNTTEAAVDLRMAIARKADDVDSLTDLSAILIGEFLDARISSPLSWSPTKKKKKKKGKKHSQELDVEAKLDEALELLTKAIKTNPQFAEARFHMGTVYKIRGNLTAAQEQFRHSVALRDSQVTGQMPETAGQGVAMSVPTSKLKIYVYDVHPRWNAGLLSLNMQQCRQSIYSGEVYIHEQLLLSPYLTLDPSEADLFFIPFYAACFLSSNFVKPGPGWPDNDVDIGKTYREVQHILRHVEKSYPFWNSSSGRNHVMVFSSDWGSCQGPFLELHNSVMLITSGDRTPVRQPWYAARAAHHMGSSPEFADRCSLPCYQPHKDIAIPPMLAVPSLIKSYQGRNKKRDIKVYFRGTITGSHKAMPFNKDYSLGIRQYLVSHYSSEPGWLVSSESNPQSYHSELSRSVFCLAPAGWELWSVRFFESMLLGCIPVILSKHIELPFESQLNYSSFTVKAPEQHLEKLPTILNEIDSESILRMQNALTKVWKLVTYQRPPQKGDAWDSIILELASRVKSWQNGAKYDSW